METESKGLRLELKADGEEGAFSATFATLNVVDHHGDVTVPGAFVTGKEVLIGAYQHEIFNLPVGKGVIRADEERAWVEGQFFLDTGPGADTYRTVKAAGPLMEWSYIFQVRESSDGEFEAAPGTRVPVRFLKSLDVWSVDPVLRGAGIDTRTDAIKGLAFQRGTFVDHAEQVLASLQAFGSRSKSLADIRAKEGRVLSSANVERLGAIAEELRGSAAALDELVTAATPKKSDLHHLFLEFQRNVALAEGYLVPA